MLRKYLVAVVALLARDIVAQNVNVGKLLRFGCAQLVIERIDPIVNPGMTPSTHTHQIVGGNSFNASVRENDASHQRLISVYVTDNSL
jgi:hypothetical protein